ncbi:MAG: serpin family protein [Lachnospiraceae bacterium]|nr:serpin family protein [Lachnospiraceae bacterium]
MKRKLTSVIVTLITAGLLISCGQTAAGPSEPSSAKGTDKATAAEAGETEAAENQSGKKEDTPIDNQGTDVTETDNGSATATETELSSGKDGGKGQQAPSGQAQSPQEGPPVTDGSLSSAVNSFNWKLLGEMDDKGNLFYSPYSLFSALALTDIAAKGDTKTEIESALSITDLQAIESEMKDYLSLKAAEKSAVLNTANAVWLDKSLKTSDNYETDFVAPAKDYFGGDFFQADFKNGLSQTKQQIKDWVSEKTNGFIPDYESAATGDTMADVLNAVYFYGEWEFPFIASSTAEETFHGLSGDRPAQMMSQKGLNLRYLREKDGISALAFPYRNTNIEMDLFIPAEGRNENISELWGKTRPEEILSALDKAELTSINYLSFPKFQMDVTMDGLTDTLKNMGIQTAFSQNADFSGLAEAMYISSIAHRAKIEVDEEGSRASAVTEAVMEITSAEMDGDIINFIADKPFLYLIRDKETGIILFTGRLNDIN